MSVNGKPILQRTFEAELQLRDDRELEGCVVPYGEAAKVRDMIRPGEYGAAYYERFEPGAFRSQIKAADKIELCYEHRSDLASSVGVGVDLNDRPEGLYGSFRLHATEFGKQAMELFRSGVLRGFSIDFVDMFTHPDRDSDGTVVRRNCRLYHVALTRRPAYAGAVITTQRSRDQWAAEFGLPTVEDEQLDRLRAVGIAL